ncbi:MAG: pantoate--beta-alanine ligase [Pirellulaceae bacterium]
MHLLKDKQTARQWVEEQTSAGRAVGLVPTMGALHAGHLSLVEESLERCDSTVATIFVNPTQFAAHEDLNKYPRTLDADLEMLLGAGVDAVFVPEASTIYRPGFSTYVSPPDVGRRWEGEHRPDHFRGVTTIVAKLFHLLPTTHAFFGRKDYQQARVLQAMVDDLDFAIKIVVCPIVREADGLALSSRNRYLDPSQRSRALALYRALQAAQDLVGTGERRVTHVEACMQDELQSAVDQTDYSVVVDADSLEPIDELNGSAVALVAARVGETRLIDNVRLDPNGETADAVL